MSEKRDFIPLRYLMAALLLSGTVLANCTSTPTPTPISHPTSTPTPVPPLPTHTPAPPTVTVTRTPDVPEVEVGQKIAFTVKTESQNVQFRWSATYGTLSAFEGSAVIYTAPDTEGVDIVTLEASNDGGTTTEHFSLKIIAHPPDTPTPTPQLPDAVTIDSINLRSGPGTVYDVIDVLKPNQVLTVTGRSDTTTQWLRVSTDQAQKGWIANRSDLVTLNLPPEQIPIVSPPPTPTPQPFTFTGKVCKIEKGWDLNTIFLRQDHFDALGLPVGTKVTVTMLDTGKSIEKVTLGLDDSIVKCSVRLSGSLREDLGVAGDTDMPLDDRPERRFSIRPS